jgi:hypothetical protein
MRWIIHPEVGAEVRIGILQGATGTRRRSIGYASIWAAGEFPELMAGVGIRHGSRRRDTGSQFKSRVPSRTTTSVTSSRSIRTTMEAGRRSRPGRSLQDIAKRPRMEWFGAGVG